MKNEMEIKHVKSILIKSELSPTDLSRGIGAKDLCPHLNLLMHIVDFDLQPIFPGAAASKHFDPKSQA